MTWKYELMPNIEAVREQIRKCEGKHVQQAIFSTFMDSLTQVCFTEETVRGMVRWEGNRSWIPSRDRRDGVFRNMDRPFEEAKPSLTIVTEDDGTRYIVRENGEAAAVPIDHPGWDRIFGGLPSGLYERVDP